MAEEPLGVTYSSLPSSGENLVLANRVVGVHQDHMRDNAQRIHELETQRSSLFAIACIC